MSDVNGKWGWSFDGETYHGQFDTKEEAIADASFEGKFVGRYRAPIMPWEIVDADALFDWVLTHDDYAGEWAEDCLECSKEQEEDLAQRVAAVFKVWCEEHDLVPKFGIVVEEIKI